LRLAIFLSVIAALTMALFVNWRTGLGVGIGSLVAYFNFVWLYRGTERLVERMLVPNAIKSRLVLPVPWRYILIIAVAYVIFKGYPRMLVGFIVGLAVPVLASMGEGIYEAIAISKIDQASE
jgi:hypothetical protein